MFGLFPPDAQARDIGMYEVIGGGSASGWDIVAGIGVTFSLVAIVFAVLLFFSRK